MRDLHLFEPRPPELCALVGAEMEHYRLLYSAVRAFDAQTVLEIGTGVGTGTTHFGVAGAAVTTIDPMRSCLKLAENKAQEYGFALTALWGPSTAFAFSIRDQAPFDIVYIDGEHTPDALRHDIAAYAPLAKKLVLIDDIYMNGAMLEIWRTEAPKHGETHEYPGLHVDQYGRDWGIGAILR